MFAILRDVARGSIEKWLKTQANPKVFEMNKWSNEGKSVADGKRLRFMVRLERPKPEGYDVTEPWYRVIVDVIQGENEPEVVGLAPDRL